MMSAEPRSYAPIRGIMVTIDEHARDQYVAQIKAFAQAFGFRLRISQVSPNRNDIVAHMERDSTWIIGGMTNRLSGTALSYKIFFYSHRQPPSSPASFEPLVEGLKLHLGKVAGAVVTETK